MVNKRILEYLRMHKGHYKISDLKKKIMNEGFSSKDVDDALSQLDKETKGNNPPTMGSTMNKINKMNFEEKNSKSGESIKNVSKPMVVTSNREVKKDDGKKMADNKNVKDNNKIKVNNATTNNVVKKPKKWAMALIISIFLGWLGIDRFYMGYIGTGILKLISLGAFGVWFILDIILIATKHDFAKVEWV